MPTSRACFLYATAQSEGGGGRLAGRTWRPRLLKVTSSAGGKRYLADWMGEVDGDGWRAHFGPAYEGWMKARHAFDPNRVFTSALAHEGP